MNEGIRLLDALTSIPLGRFVGLAVIFIISGLLVDAGLDLLADTTSVPFNKFRAGKIVENVIYVLLALMIMRWGVTIAYNVGKRASTPMLVHTTEMDHRASQEARIFEVAINYALAPPNTDPLFRPTDGALSPAQKRLAAFLGTQHEDFTYYVVEQHTDDREDRVLFVVGNGRRAATVNRSAALRRLAVADRSGEPPRDWPKVRPIRASAESACQDRSGPPSGGPGKSCVRNYLQARRS